MVEGSVGGLAVIEEAVGLWEGVELLALGVVERGTVGLQEVVHYSIKLLADYEESITTALQCCWAHCSLLLHPHLSCKLRLPLHQNTVIDAGDVAECSGLGPLVFWNIAVSAFKL